MGNTEIIIPSRFKPFSMNSSLVFRGTQTQAGWLKNLNANQQQYISPTGKAISEVHEGFFQPSKFWFEEVEHLEDYPKKLSCAIFLPRFITPNP